VTVDDCMTYAHVDQRGLQGQSGAALRRERVRTLLAAAALTAPGRMSVKAGGITSESEVHLLSPQWSVPGSPGRPRPTCHVHVLIGTSTLQHEAKRPHCHLCGRSRALCMPMLKAEKWNATRRPRAPRLHPRMHPRERQGGRSYAQWVPIRRKVHKRRSAQALP